LAVGLYLFLAPQNTNYWREGPSTKKETNWISAPDFDTGMVLTYACQAVLRWALPGAAVQEWTRSMMVRSSL
jgi:hypothetical protein